MVVLGGTHGRLNQSAPAIEMNEIPDEGLLIFVLLINDRIQDALLNGRARN